ncbi:MAG: hypothetical protein H5U40_07330 [Polyangiaceae bacterium]|nr:hypothetical protein [Polyangiaceae bacterium]
MYCIRITGKRAIEYAEAHGMQMMRGGPRIDQDGNESSWRALLESDGHWDSPADEGDEHVYVDVPAPFAVARYAPDDPARLMDIEYHQSLDEAREAFEQAPAPERSSPRVVLVEVDDDGAPSRTLADRTDPRTLA